ncbi:MAG TPA: FcoT family thioesterase [Actinophytocola sp.]|uniref:FcoT family thioesterase n=1 Tax=Actinophytocola sp. TaxID=1872138 RepID=UPI002DBECCDC|nr:FcoT family thioesterase [Actinophytocola sp.]HEU5470909.1 FcoT family thioesterase [Actinophytocola sp.]
MAESVGVGVRRTNVTVLPTLFPDDPQLRMDVLRPYKVHSRYLKSATVSVQNGLPVGRGEFSIPNSCYIDDTGHFNSVEFNICYNQLVYYLLAKSIKERAVPALAAWTLDDFWERQLPDILIARFRSLFRAPIESSSFSGEVSIATITESDVRRPVLLTETTCRFWDRQDGSAEGEVLLALLNPPGMAPTKEIA